LDKSEKCDVVACESTSDFWVPIYDLLIKHLPVMLHLKGVLTDIFGKSGRVILSKISSDKNIDQIMENLSPNIRKKRDQIRAILTEKSAKCFFSASDLS